MTEPDYTDPTTRGLAIARAHRMLAICFKPAAFADMMIALDPPTGDVESKFRDACDAAGLKNKKEIDWLWAYLQHCTKAVYDPCPEAAQSGW